MIYTATINDKRKITIPKQILGKKLKPGDKVIITETPFGIKVEPLTTSTYSK